MALDRPEGSTADDFEWLRGDCEMAHLIRSFKWDRSSPYQLSPDTKRLWRAGRDDPGAGGQAFSMMRSTS